MIGWNTQKIQAIVDSPDSRHSGISLGEIAAVGRVVTSQINFRGVLHFPLEEPAEPILSAPVPVLTVA